MWQITHLTWSDCPFAAGLISTIAPVRVSFNKFNEVLCKREKNLQLSEGQKIHQKTTESPPRGLRGRLFILLLMISHCLLLTIGGHKSRCILCILHD
jgi:hypothetical protein